MDFYGNNNISFNTGTQPFDNPMYVSSAGSLGLGIPFLFTLIIWQGEWRLHFAESEENNKIERQ